MNSSIKTHTHYNYFLFFCNIKERFTPLLTLASPNRFFSRKLYSSREEVGEMMKKLEFVEVIKRVVFAPSYGFNKDTVYYEICYKHKPNTLMFELKAVVKEDGIINFIDYLDLYYEKAIESYISDYEENFIELLLSIQSNNTLIKEIQSILEQQKLRTLLD